MVEAAEQRKAVEQRRFAMTVALAFNEPKRLDEIAPVPGRPPPEQASTGEKQEFEQERWW